jgi:hypothetical protein
LSQGHRGLPKGGSLIKLLAEHRGYRHRNYLPRLTAQKVLAWVDAHKRRTGQWPHRDSGPVLDAPGETWNGVDLALSRGARGIKARTTLADLLARGRGRKNPAGLPPLDPDRILAWTEAHHTLFGVWPTRLTGPSGSTGETWLAVDKALRDGRRGLPGGSSLFRFLKEHGKVAGKVTPFKKRKSLQPERVRQSAAP